MGNLSNCLHWIDIYTVFYEESLRLFGRTLGLDIMKRAHKIGVFFLVAVYCNGKKVNFSYKDFGSHSAARSVENKVQ